MIALQPIHLWKYLSFHPHRVPTDVRRMFYLSWEDALWDLLEKKKVPKGSYVLLPEFHCGDVAKNIVSHGYKVAYYPVSKFLITKPQELLQSVRKYKPTVLVIFHAVGITNTLMKQRSWMASLPEKTILVEDCAHRVVDAEKIQLFTPGHVLMDSLRKVMPIQGSVMYGSTSFLSFAPPSYWTGWWYRKRVMTWWLFMSVLAHLVYLVRPRSSAIKIARVVEKTMIHGYDIIGDHRKGSRGVFLLNVLQPYINVEKVYAQKEQQVLGYERLFRNFYDKDIVTFNYSPNDRKNLYGWPISFPLKRGIEIVTALRKSGLMVRLELNDSPWSRKRKIVYLPLGIHITKSQQEYIYTALARVT